VGLLPARAAALATHLLWFDAAGARDFGIGTLPRWLEQVERGEVDANAEGRVRAERAGVAQFDGQGGVPPLVLARAAGVAIEKARDVGLGAVRVGHLGPAGPAAATAAEVAIGPEVALVLGPGPSWALALPSAEGLPAVFDSALAGAGGSAGPLPELAPWALLVPEGGWLIVALTVTALEPLATFHERVLTATRDWPEGPGRLLPGPWSARRAEFRRQGVAIDSRAWAELRRRAQQIGAESPAPIHE
jgi:LDH2 family malate/lactate/ureidoglycolate dehydrogenase